MQANGFKIVAFRLNDFYKSRKSHFSFHAPAPRHQDDLTDEFQQARKLCLGEREVVRAISHWNGRLDLQVGLLFFKCMRAVEATAMVATEFDPTTVDQQNHSV